MVSETLSGHGGNRILSSRHARAARSHSCHAHDLEWVDVVFLSCSKRPWSATRRFAFVACELVLFHSCTSFSAPDEIRTRSNLIDNQAPFPEELEGKLFEVDRRESNPRWLASQASFRTNTKRSTWNLRSTGTGIEPPTFRFRARCDDNNCYRIVLHTQFVVSCGGWNRTSISMFKASDPTVRRPRICKH